MRFIIAGFLLTVLFMSSCKTVNEMTVKNLAWLYNDDNQMDIQCVTVNLNDTVSRAFLAIESGKADVSALKTDTSGYGLRLKYILYKSWNNAAIADSGTVTYDFPFHRDLSVPLRTEFSFRAATGQDYLLLIRVLDKQTKIETTLIRDVLKKNSRTAGWYLLTGSNGDPLATWYLTNSEPVNIQYFGPSRDVFAVSGYGHIFPPALPPFATELRQPFDYVADTNFFISGDGGTLINQAFHNRGLFLMQSDTAHTDGLTIRRFYDGYPSVNTPAQMVEAVRYITSNKEFDQLLSSADTKAAIDSFWIATGGNVSRGVELIRKYYGRVEEANRYFTSFCEGWKTDRGMIYIVFGPPNIVYRNGSQEEWIYGEARNYRSVHFHFFKADNPFSENDYVLQRQPNYKEFWYMAVQQWRR